MIPHSGLYQATDSAATEGLRRERMSLITSLIGRLRQVLNVALSIPYLSRNIAVQVPTKASTAATARTIDTRDFAPDSLGVVARAAASAARVASSSIMRSNPATNSGSPDMRCDPGSLTDRA